MEANMDPSLLFSPEKIQQLGFEHDGALEEAAIAFSAGQLSLKGFCGAFSQAGLMEPLCYQKGRFSYSRSLPGNFISENRGMFLDIQNW